MTVCRPTFVVDDLFVITLKLGSIVWPKGVQTKITAVCWHPSNAGMYALGTEDGVLACFDSNSGAQASKGGGGSFVTAHPNASVKSVTFRYVLSP